MGLRFGFGMIFRVWSSAAVLLLFLGTAPSSVFAWGQTYYSCGWYKISGGCEEQLNACYLAHGDPGRKGYYETVQHPGPPGVYCDLEYACNIYPDQEYIGRIDGACRYMPKCPDGQVVVGEYPNATCGDPPPPDPPACPEMPEYSCKDDYGPAYKNTTLNDENGCPLPGCDCVDEATRIPGVDGGNSTCQFNNCNKESNSFTFEPAYTGGSCVQGCRYNYVPNVVMGDFPTCSTSAYQTGATCSGSWAEGELVPCEPSEETCADKIGEHFNLPVNPGATVPGLQCHGGCGHACGTYEGWAFGAKVTYQRCVNNGSPCLDAPPPDPPAPVPPVTPPPFEPPGPGNPIDPPPDPITPIPPPDYPAPVPSPTPGPDDPPVYPPWWYTIEDTIKAGFNAVVDGLNRLLGEIEQPGTPGDPDPDGPFTGPGGGDGPGEVGTGGGELEKPDKGPGESLPEAPEWAAIYARTSELFEASPIGAALSGLQFASGGGSCPTFSASVPWLNTELVIDAHCVILASVAGFISSLMIFAYTWLAVRRFIR